MWLALRFPHWALDSRHTGISPSDAVLIVESRQACRRVVAASSCAVAAGVCRGMALANAQLRLPQAQIVERRIAHEKAALDRLAGWAWRYSDQVHAANEDESGDSTQLVIELGASLRLFGGRQALSHRMKKDLQRLGYRYLPAIGKTPAAALALANAPRRLRNRSLSDLSLSCLALDERTRASLQASGLRQVGDLLRLPSSALRKRYGDVLLDYLERLRGQRPHGLKLCRLPERYKTRHELFGAIDTVQGLAFVLRRIFIELEAFLRGANATIQTLRLTLIHDGVTDTQLILRLSRPAREASHLERVASDQLSRLELAAPVQEIALATDRLRFHTPGQNALWQANGAEESDDPWPAVLDRLRARLGHEAVSWLNTAEDHRPERASTHSDQPVKTGSIAQAPRPVWLLEHPRPAPDGLHLIQGPERIETGWWDGDSVRRDYFRALDAQGRQLWVYRRLEASSTDTPVYYLHGLFG